MPAIVRPIPVEDDEHAAASRTTRRLDDEIAAPAQQIVEPAKLRVPLYDGVACWRGNANLRTEPMHAELVVHDRVCGAGVVIEDAPGLAAVHAEDAEAKQATCSEKPVHERIPIRL